MFALPDMSRLPSVQYTPAVTSYQSVPLSCSITNTI